MKANERQVRKSIRAQAILPQMELITKVSPFKDGDNGDDLNIKQVKSKAIEFENIEN